MKRHDKLDMHKGQQKGLVIDILTQSNDYNKDSLPKDTNSPHPQNDSSSAVISK
jgi:hypothetical protein